MAVSSSFSTRLQFVKHGLWVEILNLLKLQLNSPTNIPPKCFKRVLWNHKELSTVCLYPKYASGPHKC